MTTKTKCFKLAKKHNLEIYLIPKEYRFGDAQYYDINLPEGYQLDEFDDRTGLSSGGWVIYSNFKEKLWEDIHKDLLEVISYKPWFRVEN